MSEAGKKIKTRSAINLLLAVLSGLLLAMSLPPHNLAPLAWIALAPILLASEGLRPLEVLGMGLLSAFVAAGVAIGIHPTGAGLPFALFPYGWLGLLIGTVTLAAGVLRRRFSGWCWVALVAAIGVLAEWVTVQSPLPVHLALTQSRMVWLLPLCSITGIWGISFLLWWLNAASFEAIRTRRAASRPLALGLAALVIVCLYSVALGRPEPSPASIIRVAAIQDRMPGEGVEMLSAGVPAPATGGRDREALTREAATRGARLIVWSELSTSFLPASGPHPARDLARDTGSYIVPGYPEPHGEKSYDSAAIVAPDGTVLGVHRKVHPFLGERRLILAGTDAVPVATPLGPIGIEICFDTCFPDLTRHLAQAGCRLVAMPTFDPPAPGGAVHYLHSTFLPFRAAESGLPFVRADSTGLSEVVDPQGRIVGEAPLLAATALVKDVPMGNGTDTFYSRWGDWFVLLCVAATLALWFFARRRPAPDTNQKAPDPP